MVIDCTNQDQAVFDSRNAWHIVLAGLGGEPVSCDRWVVRSTVSSSCSLSITILGLLLVQDEQMVCFLGLSCTQHEVVGGYFGS